VSTINTGVDFLIWVVAIGILRGRPNEWVMSAG